MTAKPVSAILSLVFLTVAASALIAAIPANEWRIGLTIGKVEIALVIGGGEPVRNRTGLFDFGRSAA